MKKLSIACILLSAAGAAHAQSSVTLYGIIDIGVTYANSAQLGTTGITHVGRSLLNMTDGSSTGISGSRWGLRGVEDLGGDMKAVFVLENGFTLNSGAFAQGGAEFGRQAYVGLTLPVGTFTLGRQYDPLMEAVQQFSVAGIWAGSMASIVSDVNNLVSADRINNAIKYTSAVRDGLRFSAIYSFGGSAGDASQNQIWGAGLAYSANALNVGLGYLNARDPNVSFYGNTPNKGLSTADNLGALGSATTAQTAPGFAGYASAKTREEASIGASYEISRTVVSLLFINTRFEALGSNSGPNPFGYSGSVAFNTAELAVRQRLNPSFLLGLALDYTRRSSVKSDGGAQYAQLDLGTVYSLSVRTELYASTILQRATGRDSLGQAAVADINGFSASSTNHQVAVRLGIRHRF